MAVCLLIAVSQVSYAQTKQSWLKKNWHNMNARYNGLFHAKEKVKSTVKSLSESHVDDFTKVIDVFPWGTGSQREGEKGTMEEVQKKCTKVIKRHPKSRWVDDSWYVIGLSQLYQNRPIQAIETFQYVIGQYPNGEKKYDAKLGILLSYIMQEKYYDAEAIMASIKQDGAFPKRLEQQFYLIASEIYIKQFKYSQAIETMTKALELTGKKNDKARYNFILAQLYLETEQIEKSKEKFIATAKLNPVYDLAFQANLGLIKTIGLSSESSLKAPRKYLKKMLKDDKNIDYQDQIYFELGNLEMLDNNMDLAIEYYQLSAQKSTKNKDQKANSYLKLATIFFEKKNFVQSQKYFDSTAMFVSSTRPDYENIKARQIVLTDLIENLVTIFEQDSLIKLSELSKEELEKKINQQIAKEEALKQAEEQRKNQQNGTPISSDPFNTPNKVVNNATVGGSWYFYNQSAVARGSNDFQRKWGTRPKTDLWRYASMQRGIQTSDTKTDEDTTDGPKNVVSYDPNLDPKTKEKLEGVDADKRKYYKDIPFSDEAKAVALAKIEKALVGAGDIYAEDLKEYVTAKKYYLDLLTRFPKSSYKPTVYFKLYKIETELGNKDKAAEYAQLLKQNYPNDPHSIVLNNREQAEKLGSSKVNKMYEQAYNAYVSGNYAEAKNVINKAATDFAGNALQAKFDYLSALITGKTEGEVAYKEALQKIVDLYPGSAEANMADYTLALLKEKKSGLGSEPLQTAYTFEPGAKHYFICMYDGVAESMVLAGFNDYNKKNHNSENLRVNSYVIGSKNVVAVQHFDDKSAAEKYYVEFIKNDIFYKDLGIIAYENYIISQDNFRILLKETDADAYAQFFVQNYIE